MPYVDEVVGKGCFYRLLWECRWGNLYGEICVYPLSQKLYLELTMKMNLQRHKSI